MKKKILAEIDKRIKELKGELKYYSNQHAWELADLKRIRIDELKSLRKFISKLK